MVFSSTVFLFLFLPLILTVYYFPGTQNKRLYKNLILLLFSLAFYAWGEPIFVLIMLASTVLNWWIALLMERHPKVKKQILTVGVIMDIALLFVFKYVSFISRNLANIFANDRFFVEIALPIGISFFTFQMMSYLFDIYYGKAKAQKNPIYVILYISLFPQLIAGPIVRYQEVENEIGSRRETFADIAQGLKRFVYGLGKKILLANFLAQIADNVFDFLDETSVLMAWLGAIAYTLQIYFDFSGYSDMAIGLGRMFGFHFSENFNYPYIAKTVTDFWRRWHISLSTWFRDYVYIPLGGNRVKKSRWVLNLFAVWALTGIWHGANWTFLLWGLLYFGLLLIEKLTGFANKIGFLSHIYTLLAVVLAWVIFRANGIGSGISYIGNMFGIGASGFYDTAFLEYLSNTAVILIASVIGVTPLYKKACEWLGQHRFGWIECIWLGIVFALSAFETVAATYNPFIYFNF